ncbi:MAG: UbiX family flavin prenyltransferase [Candidatus Accumulibacter sp.]|jgi:4-hydroxy-3-polyprenylbenzoate decarboxylase|nr:UbiX family flavin prenyltransferase [Accumulibacter sp.]
MHKTVCLALTGASGMIYGFRLLGCLLESGCHVRLVYSEVASAVARQEMGIALPARPEDAREIFRHHFPAHRGKLDIYGNDDWNAPMASGSNPPGAMVVCPCTMGTLASIAHGLAGNLIERAADVALKERRTLILAPRETPLSAIHLENMLCLARSGAIILPLAPGFYHRPESVSGLVDFIVARILDQLQPGLAHSLVKRWGETPG